MTKIFKLLLIGFITLALAGCTEEEARFNLVFDSNGGSEVSSITTDGVSVFIMPNNPIKEGYDFEGWYLDNDVFANHFDENALLETPITEDLIVYAKWIDIEVPVIALNGAIEISIEFGDTYFEEGARCSDNVDTECEIIIAGDDVNSSILGSYFISYNSTDSEGNNAIEVIRRINVVDTTIPQISLNGDVEITIEYGEGYTDLGIAYIDNVDGEGSAYNNSVIHFEEAGVYSKTYTYTDSSGNESVAIERIINVIDTTPDLIELVMEDVIIVELGSDFVDPGAIATNNIDDDIHISTRSNYDVDKIGVYNLVYEYIDPSGNISDSIYRTITVVDTTAPIIQMDDTFVVEYNSINVNIDCKVFDLAQDSECYLIEGNYDVAVVGEYNLVYGARDGSGNEANHFNLTLKIIDTQSPVFNSIVLPQIEEGDVIDLLSFGLTANDDYDGDLSENIYVQSNVDTSTLSIGNHEITYVVEDNSGNTLSFKTTLVVLEKVYGLGDTIVFNDLQIFFKSIEVLNVDNSYAGYDKAISIEVEIKNISNDIHGLNMFYHDGFDPNGISVDNASAYFDLATDWKGSILPNAIITGTLNYEYTSDGNYVIQFDYWSEEFSVYFDVTDGVKTESDVTSNLLPYVESIDFFENSNSIGEVIEFEGLEIFVLGTSVQAINNPYADYDYAVVVELEIRNNSNTINQLNIFDVEMFDPLGLGLNDESSYFGEMWGYTNMLLPNSVLQTTIVYNYSGDGSYTIVLDDIEVIKLDVSSANVIYTDNNSNFLTYSESQIFIDQSITIGEQFVSGDFEITINSVRVATGDTFFSSGENLVIFNVTIVNIDSDVNRFNMYDRMCFGTDGIEIENAFWDLENNIESEELLPGASLTGDIAYYFDGNGSYYLIFDEYFGDEVIVRIIVG